MSITYHRDIEQGEDAWHTLRLGIVTASEINNLVTPLGKAAGGKKVQAFACEIASQRANMQIEDTFQSFDMMRGHFQEEIARNIYDKNYAEVEECGFIVRDFGEYKIGCSPDGLVGEDGGIEIKSRLAKFQVATIVADEVPDEYINQCQAFLLVTDRNWVDFVQYSNAMPLFVKRVFPSFERQKVIRNAMYDFELLVQKTQAVYSTAAPKMVQCERVEFMADDVITESTGEVK
jgi:predicted phage-related endonuclease